MAGSHNRGWYKAYRENPQAFDKHTTLEAYDFAMAPEAVRLKRTRCFFDLKIDEDAFGRVEFELLDEILPRTVENFKLLCGSKAPSGFTYQGSPFVSKLLKDVEILGGTMIQKDWRDRDVKTTHSAFEDRYIHDEGFFVPHSEAGLISMASTGLDTNGSTFYITMATATHLDGRCTAFGRITKGFDLVQHLNDTLYTQKQRPVKQVTIAKCGVL